MRKITVIGPNPDLAREGRLMLEVRSRPPGRPCAVAGRASETCLPTLQLCVRLPRACVQLLDRLRVRRASRRCGNSERRRPNALPLPISTSSAGVRRPARDAGAARAHRSRRTCAAGPAPPELSRLSLAAGPCKPSGVSYVCVCAPPDLLSCRRAWRGDDPPPGAALVRRARHRQGRGDDPVRAPFIRDGREDVPGTDAASPRSLFLVYDPQRSLSPLVSPDALSPGCAQPPAIPERSAHPSEPRKDCCRNPRNARCHRCRAHSRRRSEPLASLPACRRLLAASCAS